MGNSRKQREQHRAFVKSLPWLRWFRWQWRALPITIKFVRLYGLRYLYDQDFRHREAVRRWEAKRPNSRNNVAAKRRRVGERDGHYCANCGQREALTLDHIKPIGEGGSDTLDNWQLLCVRCHEEKDHKRKIRI